jgi:hypothetical protein
MLQPYYLFYCYHGPSLAYLLVVEDTGEWHSDPLHVSYNDTCQSNNFPHQVLKGSVIIR